jgi:hypothetical protein
MVNALTKRWLYFVFGQSLATPTPGTTTTCEASHFADAIEIVRTSVVIFD